MLIATKNVVYQLESLGSERKPRTLLKGLDVRRVLEGELRSLVALADGSIKVLEGDEVLTLKTGIGDRIDSLCVLNEKPLSLLIGTTPPFLYLMTEKTQGKRIQAFDDLEVRNQWYTPWGGPAAVRSLAKSKDGWIYADIHVGSIMQSPDNGKTWEPVTPTLHKDVHEVTTTIADSQKIYANTYLSVYISKDRGDSWAHRSKNLNNRHGRGIAVQQEDPDTILCGVSDGPSGLNVHGQLYRTEDAGVTWNHVTKGFPTSTPQNIDTFHITFAGKEVAWVTAEEVLYLSRDRGETWTMFWEAPEEILMISCNIQ